MSSSFHFGLPDDFTIDVHTHAVPDFFKDALIASGEPVVDGKVLVDGFLTPEWDLESYMQRRDQLGCNFSIMSLTAPGVSFVGGTQATDLARRLNEYMAKLMAKHPSRLGAFAVLPLPDLTASLKEIDVSSEFSFSKSLNECELVRKTKLTGPHSSASMF